jgi:hypothetical protein
LLLKKNNIIIYIFFFPGATPLEAIAAGTAYINPVFKTRKYLHENSVYECLSQHTFAQELGAPYVYNYTEGDAESAFISKVRI